MPKNREKSPENKAGSTPTPDSSAPKPKHKKPRTDRPKTDEDEYEVFIEHNVWYYKLDHSILVKGQRGGWGVVAKGFFLYIKFKTTDEYENVMWVLEIQPDDDRPSIFLEVPHEDFFSASKLKKLIGRESFSLQITDTDLSKLHEYLFNETKYKVATKITRFGYHQESGVFFFANAAVKDGRKLLADQFNIIESKPYYLCMPNIPKKGRHPFTLTEHPITFNQWFDTYQQAHLYENSFVPASFYVMSLFRDIVIDRKSFSPILYLKGSAGTGKSSIVRNLTCLFGFKGKDINLKSKNTASALVKLVSQSSNTLVWMDEFYNKFEHEGLLQAMYDNAGYHLSAGVGTSETAEVDIKSTLALTSNYVPQNPVFFSRCIFIPINSVTKTEAQRSAYESLLMLEDIGLGVITVELLNHRALIEERFDQDFAELYQSVSKAANPETPERLKQNITANMVCAYTLSIIGKVAMTEYTNHADILAEFTRISVDTINRQKDIAEQNSELTVFMETIQLLHSERKITEGVHYRIHNDLLSFHHTIFGAFADRYRRIHNVDGPDRGAISDALAQFFGKTDKDEIQKGVRFHETAEDKSKGKAKESPRDSISVPYEPLRTRFSLTLEIPYP